MSVIEIMVQDRMIYATIPFDANYYPPLQSVGWDLPHGHSLQARCSDLGMYKLLGESRVLCSNGLWAPRMPSCVPTTLLTNYSGTAVVGSAAHDRQLAI